MYKKSTTFFNGTYVHMFVIFLIQIRTVIILTEDRTNVS